jgi:hypothetical protein
MTLGSIEASAGHRAGFPGDGASPPPIAVYIDQIGGSIGMPLSLKDFSFPLFASVEPQRAPASESTQKVPSVNFDPCFNARKFPLIKC